MAKILIVGAGAVGSVYGVKLAKSGNDVHFYVKENQRETLSKSGIELETIISHKRSKLSSINIKVVNKLKNVSMFDYILLCVRFEQQENAFNQLKKSGFYDTPIVALQTGISSIDALSKTTKNLIIFAPGIAAYKRQNRVYFFMNRFIPTYIGNINDNIDENIIKLSHIFSRSGIPTKITKEVNKKILTFITIIVPLTAASIYADCSFKKLIKDKNIIKIGIKGIRETNRIFKKKNFFNIIPVNLIDKLIKISLILTKNISKTLIESYTSNMRKQTKIFMEGFLKQADSNDVKCPNLNFLCTNLHF